MGSRQSTGQNAAFASGWINDRISGYQARRGSLYFHWRAPPLVTNQRQSLASSCRLFDVLAPCPGTCHRTCCRAISAGVYPPSAPRRETGGWGGIRTHGTLTRTAVFKTAALNRSATHPWACRYSILAGPARFADPEGRFRPRRSATPRRSRGSRSGRSSPR